MAVKKYPDKKNVKIYKPTSASNKRNGNFDRPLDEEVPEYLARSTDKIIKPENDNNTMIVMGRDRFYLEKKKKIIDGSLIEGLREDDHKDPTRKTLVSGYSNHQGAGAIDIVVGRGAPYAFKSDAKIGPLYTTVDESGSPDVSGTSLESAPQVGQQTSKHPGLMMDAARIYISQMADIDRYFGIDNSQPTLKGEDNPSSAIILKADRLRMHSRRDIKIVAGGDGVFRRDSNGYFMKEAPKIHLMVGNGRLGGQQPVPLGHNLLKCIKRIYSCQQNILEVINNLMSSQMALNIVVSNSIRVSPAGPTVCDPVSQAMSVVKSFSDMNDMFNIYFEKFWNIPTDEFGYLNQGNAEFILSRNITIN